MVSPRRSLLRAFRRDQRGATLVEGLLAFPVILLACAVIIEFGVAVIQYNQTVKALQIGARQLAVSDPIATNFTAALTTGYGTAQGVPTPSAAASAACGAGTTACTTAGMNRLIFGSDNRCDTNVGSGVTGMCDLYSRIRATNVLVTYHRSGLGYVGRPGGPVPTITIEVRNLNFEFLFLGAIMRLASLGGNSGFPDAIAIPANPVTITGEDLRSIR